MGREGKAKSLAITYVRPGPAQDLHQDYLHDACMGNDNSVLIGRSHSRIAVSAAVMERLLVENGR
jgi:hypothetical protein